MAVVVSAQPSLQLSDPTAALKQALVGFENILTDDEKQQYRSSSTKPDASSVITFVAQIDANNSKRAGRCVAPRLYTFLEAIQQFTSIVDTFVSSNPKIAALIWGGVKTTILIACNIASYFDKITVMIMTVGLQLALCEYYAIIVRLCMKVLEISRRTAIAQILLPVFNPFESEFKPFHDDLDQALKGVHLQISLAAKQAVHETSKLLELESKNQAAHRQLASKFHLDSRSEHVAAQQWRTRKAERDAAKMRSAIKTNLSTTNQARPWKQAMRQRVPETAEWFKQDPSFGDWRGDPGTAILWCSGTLGAGKTILVSNVIAYLHTVQKPTDTISYYFCRPDDQESLTARNILGSLTRQMLDTMIDRANADALLSLYNDSHDLETDDMIDFVTFHLQDDRMDYLIIDGLDECSSGEVEKFASAMSELCGKRVKDLKILCSGRPELERELFRTCKPKYRMALAGQNVESDIDRYITTTLDQCLEDEKLKLYDPTLVLKIAEALREGSDGMFLWIHLTIEDLCTQQSDNEILNSLERLPRGLSELLSQKFTRVRKQIGAQDAIRTLQYCGVAKRPLVIEELREVLRVSLGQTSLDQANLPNNMERIISDCCGLTVVDEEERTVHFVHHSVRKYLFTAQVPHRFIEAEVDKYFGVLCMTYLNFNDFRRQVAKVNKGTGVPLDPLKLGVGAITHSSSIGNRLARKLLRHRRQLQTLTAGELERKSQEILGVSETLRRESEIEKRNFAFYSYASGYWIHHLKELDNDNDQMWRLFCRSVESGDIVASPPWRIAGGEKQRQITDKEYTQSLVKWALSYGHTALLLQQVLHKSGSLTEVSKGEILNYAAKTEKHRLLENIVELVEKKAETLARELVSAAEDGRPGTVAVLLTAGAVVNPSNPHKSPLQAAAAGGHMEVVERLLAAQADVNAASATGYSGRTALQAAAEGGHIEVVERLLAAQADVNAASAAEYGGRTALQAAAAGGHMEVVERLLAAQADVNAPAKNNGRTALQAAAEGGHIEVVERLLAAQADVNAAPAAGYGARTALQAAAAGGHMEVVERLLPAQADVNAAPSENIGRTALQAAAAGGYMEVVERLLAAQADINAPPSENMGRTALQAAAEGGYIEVVERLLAAQADVNATPAARHGVRTALQAAAEGGHTKVVERLQKAGARSKPRVDE